VCSEAVEQLVDCHVSQVFQLIVGQNMYLILGADCGELALLALGLETSNVSGKVQGASF